MKQPVAYSGVAVFAGWWYWTGCIAKEQSRLARINRAKTSRRLRKLYRIRRRRFRLAVNARIKTIVEDAYALGLSKIVVGDVKGIREDKHSNKANAMVNNFWSFKYIIQRIREKAEEHGIRVAEASEHKHQAYAHSAARKARGGIGDCSAAVDEAKQYTQMS